MCQFLKGSDVLQLVVDFIGFLPSAFYLSECSRSLHRELSPVIYLSETEYSVAVHRGLVNPKYLRLRVNTLSDIWIRNLTGKAKAHVEYSVTLEALLRSRPIDEVMRLERESLDAILECSVVCLNVSMYDIALKCIVARGYKKKFMPKLLRFESVQAAVMQADALEWLIRLTSDIPLGSEVRLAENLLVNATKYRAQRCADYLKTFARDWREIPGMLEAYAYAGDFERVKFLCSEGLDVSMGMIHRALRSAVEMQHLEIAAFLRSESFKRNGEPSFIGRVHLVEDLLKSLFLKPHGGPSLEFLTWLFEGIDDVSEIELNKMPLLQYACHTRRRALCHFLVSRGCTSLPLRDKIVVTLENHDLLGFLDLCCGLENLSIFYDYSFWNPEVELFLLKRGIRVRSKGRKQNPVVDILWDEPRDSSFASRVELIKQYLVEDQSLATWIHQLSGRRLLKCISLDVTPLGALALIGTPGTEIWSGKRFVGPSDFIATKVKHYGPTPAVDEWKRTRPDDTEIRALRDIKKALLEHGADPDILFAPGALNQLVDDRTVSAGTVKRLIHGRADVNHKDVIYRHTPLSCVLQWKLRFQRVKVADTLLKYGADINDRDDSGRTLIFQAIALNNRVIIDYLISRRADLTIPDQYGARPIDIARECVKANRCSADIVERIEEVIGETEERDIGGLRSIHDLISE